MEIDIRKKVINIKLRNLFLAILFTAAFVLIAINSSINWADFGVERKYLLAGIFGLYLVINIFFFIRNYHYLFFTIQGKNLVFKFYSLRPFSAKNSIQIPMVDLDSFEIKNKFMGLSKDLYLKQKTAKGVASYKPIGLAALNKEELNLLVEVLSRVKSKIAVS